MVPLILFFYCFDFCKERKYVKASLKNHGKCKHYFIIIQLFFLKNFINQFIRLLFKGIEPKPASYISRTPFSMTIALLLRTLPSTPF